MTRPSRTTNRRRRWIQHPISPIGTYTVAVDYVGLQKFVQQNIVIAVDQTRSLNFTAVSWR